MVTNLTNDPTVWLECSAPSWYGIVRVPPNWAFIIAMLIHCSLESLPVYTYHTVVSFGLMNGHASHTGAPQGPQSEHHKLPDTKKRYFRSIPASQIQIPKNQVARTHMMVNHTIFMVKTTNLGWVSWDIMGNSIPLKPLLVDFLGVMTAISPNGYITYCLPTIVSHSVA